jgi:hypothetical protein
MLLSIIGELRVALAVMATRLIVRRNSYARLVGTANCLSLLLRSLRRPRWQASKRLTERGPN